MLTLKSYDQYQYQGVLLLVNTDHIDDIKPQNPIEPQSVITSIWPSTTFTVNMGPTVTCVGYSALA